MFNMLFISHFIPIKIAIKANNNMNVAKDVRKENTYSLLGRMQTEGAL